MCIYIDFYRQFLYNDEDLFFNKNFCIIRIRNADFNYNFNGVGVCRMTAREKIECLFDSGTFVETDAYVVSRAAELNAEKIPGDGVVAGYGTMDGRLVYAAAQESSFMGGALGEMQAKKIADTVERAARMGAPYIGLLDCSGVRIQEGLDALAGFGQIITAMSSASGVIPMVSAVMGPCPAGMSFVAQLADFIFMTEKAAMSVNGAEALKAAGNLEADEKTVGGVEMNTEKNGCVHFTADTDEACLAKLKELVALLPDNNLSGAPAELCNDDLNRTSGELASLTKKEAYNVKDVIRAVTDNGYFLEVHEKFAGNIVIGFGKMNGSVIGIVANQNAVQEGALSVKACIKASRFVQFCDSFNIPILTLTDTAGFVPCICEEKQGLARALSKLVYTFSQATVAKVNVIINKAYGSAYVAMNSKSLGADFTYAWEGSDIAPMEPIACASVLYHDEIAASDDQAACRKEKAKEYRAQYGTPLHAASRGYVDDVIEPSSTRARVISAFEMLATKRVSGPARKHGNK